MIAGLSISSSENHEKILSETFTFLFAFCRAGARYGFMVEEC